MHLAKPTVGAKKPAVHGVTTLLPPQRLPFGHTVHVSRVSGVSPVVYDPFGHLRHASALPGAEYKLSAPQFVHFQAPAAENVPLGQVWIGLLPSQREPAGHVVHVSRVVELAPVVYEPAAHVEHSFALPAWEYLLSAPQSVHLLLPALLKVPLGHVRILLSPSQRDPAGQREHAFRVFTVGPVVYDPAGHVEHLAAPATLYLLSAPHCVHTLWPAGEKYPSGQITCLLVPSHLYPSGHTSQSVRVTCVPPDVKDPSLHVEHCSAACFECFVSWPHWWHLDSPPSAKKPGVQRVCVELPSHEYPVGHSSHVSRVSASPPLVWEPAGQIEHSFAPSCEYWLSSPHFSHVLDAAGA